MAKGKKKDIKITTGTLHVLTSENNTIITLTNEKWDKVIGGWTGLVGYKGAKQNTPYAAEVLTKHLMKQAEGFGLEEVGVVFRWPGMARDGVFKWINELGNIQILYIKEDTGIQFGWCKGYRPKRM